MLCKYSGNFGEIGNDSSIASSFFSFVFQFSNIRMVGNLLQDEIFNIHITIRDNVTMHCNIVAVDE